MFSKVKSITEYKDLPVHIGIIMDGNGRWAKKRGLPRYAGHSVGAKVFKTIVRECNKIGIKFLTVFAFSTENWLRPKKEVDTIMNLLYDYLKDAKNYKHENVKVKFIGDISGFEDKIVEKMKQAEIESKDATGINLNIAVNYGGKSEIINAVKLISNDIINQKLDINDINESVFENYLYTSGQPKVDLIIRPSGEHRISNFMIWQSAYAEYVFLDVLWPDFKKSHLIQAIEEFSARHRRFGGI